MANKKYNIYCYVQFGKCFDLDIDAPNKEAALSKVKKAIEFQGYQYCPGDEIVIQIDDCTEIGEDK